MWDTLQYIFHKGLKLNHKLDYKLSSFEFELQHKTNDKKNVKNCLHTCQISFHPKQSHNPQSFTRKQSSRMNLIKDKILYSGEKEVRDYGKYFIYRVLDDVHQELDETGDRDWMVDTEDGCSTKLSSIYPISIRIASAFSKLGFKAGDVIQTGYSTCLDFYWPIFGAWMCGGVVSLGDPSLNPDLIKYQILDLKSKIIVCSSEHALKYSKIVASLTVEEKPMLFVLDVLENKVPIGCRSFTELFEDDGLDAPSYESLPPYNPLDRLVVLWSAGTTGNPKGIVHCHQTLQNVAYLKNICNKSLITNVGYHMAGFLHHLSSGILGRTISYFVKERLFSGDTYLNALEKYQPEYFVCSVSSFTSIANAKQPFRNLPKLKIVTPLGGSLSPGTVERVMKILGEHVTFLKIYGGTEMGLIGKCVYSKDYDNIGQLGPGVQLYCADPVTGSKLGPHQEGKFMVKTRSMMLGYLKKSDNDESYDSDGFAYSGDMGYYDERGNIYFKCRMKDVLKVENFWFGPGEIENILLNEPEILDAVVWGVYDNTTGSDKVHLGVIFENTENSWTEADVKSLIAKKLPRTRHITGQVHILTKIPYSVQGKKLRREMQSFVNGIKC